MSRTGQSRGSICSLIGTSFIVRSFFGIRSTIFPQPLTEETQRSAWEGKRDNICSNRLRASATWRSLDPVYLPSAFTIVEIVKFNWRMNPHRRPLSDAGTRTPTDFRREVGDTPFHRSNYQRGQHMLCRVASHYFVTSRPNDHVLNALAAVLVLTYLRVTT
jgi:hypothetical protein